MKFYNCEVKWAVYVLGSDRVHSFTIVTRMLVLGNWLSVDRLCRELIEFIQKRGNLLVI